MIHGELGLAKGIAKFCFESIRTSGIEGLAGKHVLDNSARRGGSVCNIFHEYVRRVACLISSQVRSCLIKYLHAMIILWRVDFDTM